MQSSIWFQTLAEKDRRSLGQSDALPPTAEVVIIGAGMIGLMTAYYLDNAGVSNICVVDRDLAIGEASGANAGGLWFGEDSSQAGPLTPLLRASSQLYEELIAAPTLDFDFRRLGLLQLIFNEEDEEKGERTAAAVRAAGFQAEKIDRAQLYSLEPSMSYGPESAIFYAEEAQVHPGRMGLSLVRHLRARKVRFCFRTEVASIEPKPALRVIIPGATIDAHYVVVACGAWTPLLTRTLGWEPPIKPMRGQLLAREPVKPLMHHTIMGRNFYHWQLSEGHVAGGGTVEDVGFERGVNNKDLTRIRADIETLYPDLRGLEVACAWTGFRPFCQDLRPVIGRIPEQENIFAGAGHFKKGIMLAPATGRILADLITTGHTLLPATPFDPARFGSILGRLRPAAETSGEETATKTAPAGHRPSGSGQPEGRAAESKAQAGPATGKQSPAPATGGGPQPGGTQAAADAFINGAGPLWKEATDPPFLQALSGGSLPADAFSRWLAQDYLFAKGLTAFQAITLSKSPRDCFRPLITGLAALESEMEWFEEHAGRLGLSLEARPQPACRAYLDFLMRSAYTDPYPALLAVLYGVEVSYLEAWSGLPRRGPHAEFIERWSSEKFRDYVDQLHRLVCRHPHAAGQELFNAVLGYERDFWKMALGS